MTAARRLDCPARSPWLLVLSMACTFARTIPAQSLDISQYAHTVWRIRDGFAKGEITAIAQTPDGYLWLATYLGLLRFDGVRATPWRPPAGQQLPGDAIWGLLVSRDSTLWVATSKGLVSLRAGKLTSYPELSGRAISSLVEARDGTIWFAAALPGEVCAIRQAKVSCEGRGLLGNLVSAIAEDSSGNTWVASMSAGVWRWSPGPADRVVPGGSRLEFLAFAELGDSAPVLMTNEGLKTLRRGRIRDYSISPIERHVIIDKLLRTRDGAIWMATHQGLIHLHDGHLDSFGVSDGLSGVVVNALYEDREGSVWVATRSGLERFRSVAIPMISLKEGLASDGLIAVQATRDGSIWLAGPTALQRWRAGRLQRIASPSPRSLGVDDAGQLWASTSKGVEFFDGSRFRLASTQHGSDILALAGDGHGGVWAIGPRSGLSRITPGGLTTQLAAADIANPATTLLPDTVTGNVWLGHFGRDLSYVTPEGRIVASYTAHDGLGAGRIMSLRPGADGAIWAATAGGLSRVKDSRIATLSSKNGLPCDAVHWSMEDGDRTVWLYMPCGLVRIPQSEIHAWRQEPTRIVEATTFDADDGVSLIGEFGSLSPHVTVASDGRIWFVAPGGVSVIDPRHLVKNPVPPPVHIEQIVADGKAYGAAALTNGRLQMPPRIRNLAIDYTATSLAVPEKVRFRFRLEGQDSGWREVVNQRHVEYSNLSPGNYTFRLTASNNSGVWNAEGTSLGFSVAPAFNQTNWFWTLVAAAALAVFWVAYRLRIAQLRLREARFRETIEAMPALAFIALPDGQRTFVNRRWTDYTGLTLAEALGAGWQGAVHPDDIGRVDEGWRTALSTGAPLECELRLRGANGEYRWFLTRAVPVRDKRGQITNWYGVTTDIEERKRAEAERERYRQIEAELAHVNRVTTMGELTASLAHEIRQPIASTVLNANVMLRCLDREEPTANLDKAREATKRILRDGARADDIITRVRSLYKKSTPQRERVDMNEVIRDVLVLMQSETTRHSITLRLELADDLPGIRGDRVQLQQVFMNLLLNAIEAMKEQESRVLTVSSRRQNGVLSFTVRDTGVGLPSVKGDEIFTPFFTTKPQGTGMGLSICRSIVESHGGQLYALPNDDGGATFHVVLPVRVSDANAGSDYSGTTDSELGTAARRDTRV